MTSSQSSNAERVQGLACWSGEVKAVPLGGGITNTNFTVEDNGCKYVVRLCEDIPVHHVMVFNVLSASRAASAIGVSPEVVHAEPGVMIIRFVNGDPCTEADVRDPRTLERIVALLNRFHRQMPGQLRGAALLFWVFQIIRDYAHTLTAGGSRHLDRLPGLIGVAEKLETAVGPVNLVFGHNDLLAANFINDGSRLWLIDFDYAGFNSPLFDLSNLASNNQLSRDQERWLLEAYFEREISDGSWRAYHAMKCASLLRETLWSMVSEIHSEIDFDYAAYTADYLERFERSHAETSREFGF